MFNFTTQTVFNDIVTSGKGQNLWVATNGSKPSLRIGNTRFNADLIQKIFVKTPTLEACASVTFDMSKVALAPTETEGVARIVLYIGLSMNSLDSLYANPFVYKGKPFYVEFKIMDTAAKTAKECKRVAEKFLLFEADEKLLDISVNGSNVTISGVNGYQQIRKAILQKFNPAAKNVDCCTTQGEFEDVVVGVPVVYTIEDGEVVSQSVKLTETGETEALASNEVAILPGLEAFGDYNWIIHNLRLPTYENTNFWGANKEEMPATGTSYTQFTIVMRDTRNKVGGESVGMVTTSETTHVLYVAGKAAKDSSVTTTPADKVYKELYTLASSKIDVTADSTLDNPYNFEDESGSDE